jgi:REP element-mobilizing transposase RayT
MAGRKRHQQQEMVFTTWGGKRDGAGRPPKGKRSSEPHKKRASVAASVPQHVNMRVVQNIGNLRRRHMYKALREATIVAARREDFRIVHFSIQGNHVHLIAEAENKTALAKGMQGFQISAAKHINAVVSKREGMRRTGRVFTDRYHARALKTPREVRNAISYVLNNWRRHDEHLASVARDWKVDPFSSGIGFDGWKELGGAQFRLRPTTYEELVVWPARCWLLTTGWRRHGLVSFDETPGPLEPKRAHR